MIAKNIDIDTNNEYIILYKLKNDGNIVAYSCSKHTVIEKLIKLKDDPGVEIITIYEAAISFMQLANKCLSEYHCKDAEDVGREKTGSSATRLYQGIRNGLSNVPKMQNTWKENTNDNSN